MLTTKRAILVTALALSGAAQAISLEPAPGLDVNQPYYAPQAFVQQESLPIVDIRGVKPADYAELFEKQVGEEVRRGIKEAQFIDNTPEGNVEAAKYVLNTKPVAQHAAYGSDFISTLTAVMDTKEGCMEVAPGVGDWNDFQRVCFDK